jgi:hypothetical protein
MWFSSFFEKALVNLVKRLIPIRIVRLFRSTKLVEICFGSGLPVTTCGLVSIHCPRLSLLDGVLKLFLVDIQDFGDACQ